MPRDARAYLADIVDACDAIRVALVDTDLEAYKANRLVRSSVEREFTIIGEAMIVLSRTAPDIFAGITHARRIVDFRNQLTHAYADVNDALVWGTADRDAPVLCSECLAALQKLENAEALQEEL